MRRDLLLEIGTEDLPARYVMPLAEALAAGIGEGLARRGVAWGSVRALATPRRIAALIAEVAPQQPEQQVERLGPALSVARRDGQPTPAGLGFARSCGVEFDQLGEKDGKLHFARREPGRPTAELLAEVFAETLKRMDELVPKRMRWGDREDTFVRPVKWLLCLFGEQVVPLQAFDLQADRLTFGHRFHAPAAITLAAPGDYEPALKAARVWVDPGSRKARIREMIEAEAQRLSGVARIDEELLGEVTALVEWPAPIVGRMEERFMQLPPEVVVSTVETNQRYFTVFADDSYRQLLPFFITIANIESSDPQQVVAGNERVVRPRLADALFFWEQDLRQPLEAFGVRLASTTFQKDLGSLADKVARVRKLAATIAERVGVDAALVERAAALCKNDLVTQMVFEFPELQGVVGGYYATRSGEPEAVAAAIRDHYLPTQHGTPIPATRDGQILSLADKLDTLTGIFAIGQKPTASKDPFALRRAALGVLRICIEGQLALDVRELLRLALEQQPAGARGPEVLAELWEFMLNRFLGVCSDRLWQLEGKEQGAEGVGDWPIAEMVQSVAAMEIGQPLDLMTRAEAVFHFLKLPEATALAAANKRIRNILRQAGEDVGADVDARLFEHDAERALFRKMQELAAENARISGYTEQLVNLASLREPVDAFFDAVMVNAEDPGVRENRLALLVRLDALCRSVADLSCLPG